MRQNGTFHAQGDLLGTVRLDKLSLLPKLLAQLRNITEIDVLVADGRKPFDGQGDRVFARERWS